MRTAPEVDPADVLDGQWGDVLDVALHQPLEAVAAADDLESFETRADRGRADDAVDAWRGSAADENCERVMVLQRSLFSFATKGQ